jgi:hypothetical protein
MPQQHVEAALPFKSKPALVGLYRKELSNGAPMNIIRVCNGCDRALNASLFALITRRLAAEVS